MKKIIYSILIGFFLCSVSYAEMTESDLIDIICQTRYENYRTAESEDQTAESEDQMSYVNYKRARRVTQKILSDHLLEYAQKKRRAERSYQ